MSGITNPAEKYFKDGLWTFDGLVWRPQNQLLAYRDTVRELYNNNNAAAGANTKTFTAVPAGEVHVISSIMAANYTTAACTIAVYVKVGASAYLLEYTLVASVTRYVSIKTPIVLKAGDAIGVDWYSCVLNDVIVAHINGYKFKIAE